MRRGWPFAASRASGNPLFAPQLPSASPDHDPLREEPHRAGLLPGGFLVGTREMSWIVLDHELVTDRLQADEVVVLADDDLAARVDLGPDLREDRLLVAFERDLAFDVAGGELARLARALVVGGVAVGLVARLLVGGAPVLFAVAAERVRGAVLLAGRVEGERALLGADAEVARERGDRMRARDGV